MGPLFASLFTSLKVRLAGKSIENLLTSCTMAVLCFVRIHCYNGKLCSHETLSAYLTS